jgi:hypothetical protein
MEGRRRQGPVAEDSDLQHVGAVEGRLCVETGQGLADLCLVFRTRASAGSGPATG